MAIKQKEIFQINNGNLFFRKFHALKNINLKVNKGEKVAIIGHNGAGKTTLIDVVTGSRKLTSGSIRYFKNSNISKMREQMSVLLQSKEFLQGLKLKSYLKFYLDVYNMNFENKWVSQLIKQFDLKNFLNFFLKNLSGGQQQKVSILVSLLNRPKILFVDEILNSLDIYSQNDVLNHLKNYVFKSPETTFVSISHNEKEITALAERIIVLQRGKIINDFYKKELIKKYGSVLNYISKLKSVENA